MTGDVGDSEPNLPYRASKSRHAESATVHDRTCACLWQDVLQRSAHVAVCLSQTMVRQHVAIIYHYQGGDIGVNECLEGLVVQ